jgi:hypothetical protein
MTPLVLTFHDCGFGGRELASIGDYVVGAVEPPGLCGPRALWSFYPETARKLVRQPASSIEEARRMVEEQVNFMLRSMGVLARADRVELRVAGAAAPDRLLSRHRGCRRDVRR